MAEDTDTDSDQEQIPVMEPPVKVSGRAIIKAAWFRRLKLTKLLVHGGEGVNIQNEDGETALMVAIMSNHADVMAATHAQMVKFLLEQGADPKVMDKHGQTALTHACKERRGSGVVKEILEYGGDPVQQDKFGRNALHLSAQHGDSDVLELMARHCKSKGKEVIIVNKKTAVVSPCVKEDPPRFGVTVQSASVPPIVVKPARGAGCRPQSQENLAVPVSGDVDMDHGRRCHIYGSPRPKSKFSHGVGCEEGAEGERRASFTLSVKPIAEVSDNWIPRDDNVPSDIESSPGEAKETWAVPKPPPHQRKLVRRATTMAISPTAPIPPPNTLQEGAATLDTPADLTRVKSDLLRWEKELSTRGLPRSKHERAAPCQSKGNKPSTSGVHLTSITDTAGWRPSHAGSSSVYTEGCEGGTAGCLPALDRRARVIGPRGKVLEKRSSGKLLDHLSHTRPGTLPPLNVNINRPIPGIQDGCHGDGEVEDAGDGPPDAEGLTPHQRLLALNPKRKFFNRRSQTIELADTKQLLALNNEMAGYRRRVGIHSIAQSSREGEG